MVKNTVFGRMWLFCLLLVSISCSDGRFSSGDEAKLCELPDGSIVILNKQSALTFEMNDTVRQAVLTGEAFFKVTKSDVPFEVQAGAGLIRVLGTEFSVDATDEQLDVEVESGVVELEKNGRKRKVRKGERVFYDDVKSVLKQGHAEFKHHIWTDDFKDDMRALGKEIEKGGKKLGEGIKKVSKDLKDKL
ncbi:FecR family protein [Carboxylicivirga taeanensis]|uniref:FecR family protein n=1 Tax=Carboxylicivirga taeanensis TaxID=1416875 RepID=UPI003F6DFB34